MNNIMKLAIIIGLPLGALMILLMILENDAQLVFSVYICAILGIAAVGHLFTDKEIRESLQNEGKMPRKVVFKVIFVTMAVIAAYLGWHFVKQATRI